jgi:hypothetical protein
MAAGVAAASAAISGRQAVAEEAMSRLRQISPTLSISTLDEWIALKRPEDFDLWTAALRKAGLPE